VEEVVTTIGREPKIGLLQLLVLAYFITCGGPFGIEPSVGAAGAWLTIVGMVVLALVFCMPQTLMAAELALLCKAENGGTLQRPVLLFTTTFVSQIMT